MKAHTGIMTEKQVKAKIDEELAKYRDGLYDTVVRDVIPQLMATVLMVLHKEFGFGKDRIQRVYNGTNTMFAAMDGGGLLGKPFDTVTCIQYARDKWGIDLEVKDD